MENFTQEEIEDLLCDAYTDLQNGKTPFEIIQENDSAPDIISLYLDNNIISMDDLNEAFIIFIKQNIQSIHKENKSILEKQYNILQQIRWQYQAFDSIIEKTKIKKNTTKLDNYCLSTRDDVLNQLISFINSEEIKNISYKDKITLFIMYQDFDINLNEELYLNIIKHHFLELNKYIKSLSLNGKGNGDFIRACGFMLIYLRQQHLEPWIVIQPFLDTIRNINDYHDYYLINRENEEFKITPYEKYNYTEPQIKRENFIENIVMMLFKFIQDINEYYDDNAQKKLRKEIALYIAKKLKTYNVKNPTSNRPCIPKDCIYYIKNYWNPTFNEPNPIWRLAYIRALKILAVNVETCHDRDNKKTIIGILKQYSEKEQWDLAKTEAENTIDALSNIKTGIKEGNSRKMILLSLLEFKRAMILSCEKHYFYRHSYYDECSQLIEKDNHFDQYYYQFYEEEISKIISGSYPVNSLKSYIRCEFHTKKSII
ncbi:MAG: hypothetical protein IKQ61_06950 [Spirochaetales bacterium]|nr:hypothetical protein [Spirochaetales bacterium]